MTFFFRSDQREKWLKFFDEVDELQRLKAGSIPEDVWIPLSTQDVQAYLKRIAPPKTSEENCIGKYAYSKYLFHPTPLYTISEFVTSCSILNVLIMNVFT